MQFEVKITYIIVKITRYKGCEKLYAILKENGRA